MMLTSDLMRVTVSGKKISPSLLKEKGKSPLEKAQVVLDIFAACKGRSRGDIQEAIQEASSIEVDHKLIKGLAKVAMNQCDFTVPELEIEGDWDAKRLRRVIFERAAKRGPVALDLSVPGRVSAQEILNEVASELEGSATQIFEYLYADRREMHLLEEGPKAQNAQELIQRYNLALCQSLLLHASTMKITLWSPEVKWLRFLFRRLKFYRLMFQVFKFKNRIEIVLDGPQSLLKQSSRYGMQFALFLPVLPLLSTDWTLEAEILWGKKRKFKKELLLNQDSSLRSHYRATGTWKANVEEWFEQRFYAKEREWSLSEGGILDLGEQQVLIPDYCLKKGDVVAYVEIIGFWRKKHVQSVIKKAPKNVLFALSKKYSGDTTSLPKNIQDRIVVFSEVLSVKSVLEKLSLMEAYIIKANKKQ